VCQSCLENRFISSIQNIIISGNNYSRCAKCGRFLVSTDTICFGCRTTPVLTAIDSIIPLFPYISWGQDLLTSWKIVGMRGLSWPFAQCLAHVILSDPDISGVPIVPVPPRPGKMSEKGWDQIEDLVKILYEIYKIPVLRCLSRTGGLQQKKLGRMARLKNIRGNISVIPGLSIPERVIILDDLVTTGSTLDSCAEALKIAGCGKVYGLALFFD